MQAIDASSIQAARHSYAEQICRLNGIRSPSIQTAFATVPRERFLGPGPWIIQNSSELWFTEDDNPMHIYRDALIVLDEARHLNNGQPSLWAVHFDRLNVRPGDSVLHLGCGTGYYTAILAELTGPGGKVVAVEIEEHLAARARVALAPWPQVTVIQGDGSLGSFDPASFVVVSAGATHPLAAWLNAVSPGGKLLFPLTTVHGEGIMALVVRIGAHLFQADLSGYVSFIDFRGACDPVIGNELAHAFKRGDVASVHSLRCDVHLPDETCWLHGDGWCFSRLTAVPGESR